MKERLTANNVKEKQRERGFKMIEYSLGIVAGYVIAKTLTPYSPSIIIKNYHIHHWMWGSALLLIILYLGVDNYAFNGLVTGVVLEGLTYKNWKLRSDKNGKRSK